MGCASKIGSTIASSGSTLMVRHFTGCLKTRSPLLRRGENYGFLGLETLAQRYGDGGTYAVQRSLGLPDYMSWISWRLGREVVKTLQSAEETLPKNIEAIELKNLSGVADTIRQSAEDIETTLKTINDPPMDTAWVTQARKELVGV